MDSDMMNMMMQQIEKLPEFCSNPNPHNIINPSLFYAPNQIRPDPNPHYPIPSYPSSNHNNNNRPDPVSQYPIPTYPSSFIEKLSNNNSNNNSNNMAAMREMIFRMAVMQPVHIDPEAIKAPKRRNVKISKDPQSVAARHRRERISERIRILQRMVPGGTKMDTASMLDEAIHYVKFLKKQVQNLEQQGVVGSAVMMNENVASSHPTVGNFQMLR